jgi:hypothetical protein
VPESTGPTVITDNFIDGTLNAGAQGLSNRDIRITNEAGNLNDVTVSGNYLIGAGFTVEAGSTNTTYTISDVSIPNNDIGFGVFGDYYPTTTGVATVTGTTIVDFSNPTASSQALAVYEAAGLPTANVVSGTSGGAGASGSAPTTILGNGFASAHLAAGSGETNFVGGLGSQLLFGGQGANLLTYLAIGDGATGCPHSIRRRT